MIHLNLAIDTLNKRKELNNVFLQSTLKKLKTTKLTEVDHMAIEYANKHNQQLEQAISVLESTKVESISRFGYRLKPKYRIS